MVAKYETVATKLYHSGTLKCDLEWGLTILLFFFCKFSCIINRTMLQHETSVEPLYLYIVLYS